MVNAFYEKEIIIPEEPSLDYKWSPAEVNQILFRNFSDPQQAVDDLLVKQHEDVYKFENESSEEVAIPTIE
jgi:hypothetical protein